MGNNQTNQFGPQLINVAEIGRSVFEWLLSGMLLVVLFLMPATTSGSIAGERERQTLLPLQVSMMSPLSIVLGKMAAAIVFTALLILLTTPLLALTYLVGGITILDVAKGVGMVLLTATMVGAVGVACSAVAKRVQVATVLAYGFVLMISIGSLIAFGALAVLDDARGFDDVNPPKEVLMLNPFFATADVFDSIGQFPGDDTSTPLGAARQGLDEVSRVGDFQARPNTEATNLWRWYLVASLTVIYLSIGIATVRVRTPARTER
ncbi:MAG: ABC transporter permease [Actinobacteria bacterium]|nr:ABC transporter permease [Actinomycetota bacterium]